jgi:amino acid efflux transporter
VAQAVRPLERPIARDAAAELRLRRTIGLTSAVALYSGAVLGTGILVLPAVAAETAGPASIIAWTGLSLLSLPLALTFAALGRRQPVAGGFTAYIVRAFGRRWGAIAGWLFLAQVPTGTAFVGFLAASYLAAPFGLGRDAHFAIALTFIGLAYGLNLLGLRLVGAVQTVATVGVLSLVIGVVLAASRDVRADAFLPFAPFGFSAVGLAAVQVFWAFVGWEAITPLAEEFRSPERDLRRASVISVGVVAVIYLALALVTIGTHAYGAEAEGLPPFALMAERAFGPGALVVVGITGGVLAFTPLNAYVAGTSRLAYSLARSGDLPSWVGALHPRTRVPHHALAGLAIACLAATALTYAGGIRTADLLPLSTSSFVATYVLSMAAAARLLRGRESLLAAVGLVACLVVSAFVGELLAWLLVVSLAAALYVGRRRLNVVAGTDSPER